jgi:hypothetical protein
MSDADWRGQLPIRVRIMQIIVGAMGIGCFSFLCIAVLVAMGRNNPADQLMFTYIGLAMAGMILGSWIVMPGIVVSQGRKKIQQTPACSTERQSNQQSGNVSGKENGKGLALIALFQTKTIISSALLEGAVFFLLITHMLEGSMLSILAAVALLILLIAQIPTIGRVANWIDKQMRLVDEERGFG